MVQIIERGDVGHKTTGQRFADAFGRLGSQGTQLLTSQFANKESMRREDETIKKLTGMDLSGLSPEIKKHFLSKFTPQGQKVAKNLEGLSSFLSKELKARGRGSYAEDPHKLASLRTAMAPLIEQGYSPIQAFEEVFGSMQEGEAPEEERSLLEKLLGYGGVAGGLLAGGSKKKEFHEQERLLGPANRRADEGKFLGGSLREYLDPAIQTGKEKPSQILKEIPTAAIKSGEGLAYLHDPIGNLINRFLKKNEQPTASGILGERLRKGLSPEQKEGAERISDIESFLIDLGVPFPAASKAARRTIPSPAQKGLAQKLLKSGEKIAEEVAPKAEKSLAGRVTKAEPTATEMRIARTKPEERIYKRLENIGIRESQVKSFPKYASEIATDAEKRAAQAEKRIPKTVKGKDAQKIRQHEAQKHMPAAKESYTKSAARVRALEDELAKYKGADKERVKSLLEASKKDLADAESNLIGRLQNLKGINYRATAEEMTEAARKKLTDISETIAKGEEYKIAKMDYSPELIAEAKRISKKKPLPRTRHEDFYTKTHDRYANQYRDRLGKIEAEIKSLPKGFSSLEQMRNLQKEKDIIKKMIESADAENTIHRHKFSLREIAERQKAKERIAEFEKIQGHPKVQKAAQEKIWKERIKEIKTSEGRAKVTEEVIEDAARQAKTAEEAEKIRGEKNNLNKAFEDVEKEQEKIKDRFKTREPKEPPSGAGEKMEFGKQHKTPPPPPDSTKQMEDLLKHYFKIMNDFVGKIPVLGAFWRNKYGHDVVIGFGTALLDEVMKENDLDEYITPGQVATIVFGRTGQQRGIRYAANRFAKGRIKNWKINRAAELYRNHKDEKLKDYSPSIKKEARKRAFG